MRSEMPCESYQAVLLASQRSSQTGQVLLTVVRGRSDRPRGRPTVQFSPLHAAKRRWPQFQSQPCPRAKAEAERATAQSTHHFTHALTGEYMAQGIWGGLTSATEQRSIPYQPLTRTHPAGITGLWFSIVTFGGERRHPSRCLQAAGQLSRLTNDEAIRQRSRGRQPRHQ